MDYAVTQQVLEPPTNSEPIVEVIRVEQVIMERPSKYNWTQMSSVTAGRIGIDEIGNDAVEVVMVMALDTKNKINAIHRVFTGSLNSSVAHPREIFRTAILNNAARLIIYHNHPSGSLEPSEADLAFTKRLRDAGQTIGIEVLDHIIVSSNEYLSMREDGYF